MKAASARPGQANTSKYQLQLAVPSNDAAADGTSADTAVATLTLDGKPQSGQLVTFSITSGRATFSNGKQQIDNIKTLADGSAKVPFTDLKTEAGEIVAWMTNNAAVKSNEAPYSFTSTNEISIFPAIDYSAANGVAENRILAALVGGDGKVNASYSGSLIFSVKDTNVTFVGADEGDPQRKTVPATRGFADASFVCASAVGSSAYPVTITAALQDNSAHSSQRQFTFNTGSPGLAWRSSSYDGSITSALTTMGGVAGSHGAGYVSAYIVLPAASDACFSSSQSNPVVSVLNQKVCSTDFRPSGDMQSFSIVCSAAEDGIELSICPLNKPLSSPITTLTFS